jgi:hypothetical protein
MSRFFRGKFSLHIAILFALYRLGYKGRMTGHGFRGLASTILHENGFQGFNRDIREWHFSSPLSEFVRTPLSKGLYPHPYPTF